ncbi:MAG: hypothetical protein ACYC6B_09575 [Thermoleophilia bacterium]
MGCFPYIRDDDGYWQQVEVYVKKHTQADFTHGLCPECVEKAEDEFRNSRGHAGPDKE